MAVLEMSCCFGVVGRSDILSRQSNWLASFLPRVFWPFLAAGLGCHEESGAAVLLSESECEGVAEGGEAVTSGEGGAVAFVSPNGDELAEDGGEAIV